MRFALRNPDKIVAKLGEDFLDDLLGDLGDFFRETPDEEIERQLTLHRAWCGGKYPGIEFMAYRFVVLGRQFDVLRLAYYGKQ